MTPEACDVVSDRLGVAQVDPVAHGDHGPGDDLEAVVVGLDLDVSGGDFDGGDGGGRHAVGEVGDQFGEARVRRRALDRARWRRLARSGNFVPSRDCSWGLVVAPVTRPASSPTSHPNH